MGNFLGRTGCFLTAFNDLTCLMGCLTGTGSLAGGGGTGPNRLPTGPGATGCGGRGLLGKGLFFFKCNRFLARVGFKCDVACGCPSSGPILFLILIFLFSKLGNLRNLALREFSAVSKSSNSSNF